MDDITGRPSIAYLEELFKLMREYDVTNVGMADLHAERVILADDESEEIVEEVPLTPEEMELITGPSLDASQGDMSPAVEPPSNPYENPITFGRENVPYFPEKGSVKPPAYPGADED